MSQVFDLILGAFAVLASFSAVNQVSNGSDWCSQEYHSGSSKLTDKVTSFEVPSYKIKRELRQLEKTSVLRMHRKRAESLVGKSAGLGQYYLIRSSLTRRVTDTIPSGLDEQKSFMRREFHWSSADNSLLLFNFQSVSGERRPVNVGLMIKSILPVRNAYLGCYITD